MRVILFVMTLLCLPFFGMAQDDDSDDELAFPQLIQEFVITEAVYPQEKGEVQFTLSEYYNKFENESISTIPLVFEYGITERLQVEAEYGVSLFSGGKSTLGNLELGLLYNAISWESWSLSAAAEVELPTAEGSDEVEFEPGIIVAKSIGSSQVHLNVGAEIGDDIELGANLASVTPIGPLYGILEVQTSFDEDPALHFSPGLIYNQWEGWEFALGAPLDFSEGSGQNFGLAFKITFEFETIEDDD